MNKRMMKVIVVVLVISSIILACGSQTISEPTFTQSPLTSQIYSPNEPQHEIYAGFTESKTMPFVMIHRSGESLVLIQDINSPNVTGAVWTSADGKSIVIYLDSNGRPNSAVVGEETVLYSNYTNDTVDITIIHANGAREALQSKLDIDLLNRITAFVAPSYNLVAHSINNRRQSQQQDILGWAKTGLYIVGAASCITAVPGSFVVPVVGIPRLADACAGFLLGTVVRVGNALNLDIADIQSLQNNLDTFNCLGVNFISLDPSKRAVACLNVLVTEAEKQKDAADKINSNQSSLPLSITDTPEVPTDTPEIPTDTPEIPTDTQVPPTDTPIPPTATQPLPTIQWLNDGDIWN